MFKAMYATDGVGLAAPQVGVNLQMLVYNPDGSSGTTESEIVLCNPKIVRKSKETEAGEEGCLSFPEIHGHVVRPKSSVTKAFNLQGEPISLELEGWASRIFQHEYDHLDGILFIDRMSAADKTRIRPLLNELIKQFDPGIAGNPGN